jgi:DNA primase
MNNNNQTSNTSQSSNRNPHYDVDLLKSEFDLRNYARSLGISGRDSGRAYVVQADQNDKHPSGSFYPDGFLDRRTGKTIKSIQFVQQAEKLNYPRALKRIAEFIGITPTIQPNDPTARPAPSTLARVVGSPSASKLPSDPAALTDPAWQNVARQLVNDAQSELWNGSPRSLAALAYLHNERGLSDDTIRAAQLGYTDHWIKTSFVQDGNVAKLAAGLVIPHIDHDGKINAIRVRCRVGNLASALGLPDDLLKGEISPKYLSFSGSALAARHYGQLPSAGQDCVIVEGEFDCLILGQHLAALGAGAAVLTFCSAGQRPNASTLAALAAAGRVLIIGDNDSAGQTMASELGSKLPNSRALSVPVGKDVTDYLTSEQGQRAGALANWIASAIVTPSAASVLALPDTMRAAMNRYFYPAIAPTIELIIEGQRAGLLGADFDVSELLQAAQRTGRYTSENTIRNGLQYGESEFFELLTPDLLRVLPTVLVGTKEESDQQISVGKTQSKSPSNKGRTAMRWKLQTFDRIRESILARAKKWIISNEYQNALILLDSEQDRQRWADMIEPLISARLKSSTVVEVLAAFYASKLANNPEVLRQAQAALARAKRAYSRLTRELARPVSTPLPDGQYQNAAEYRALFGRAIVESNQNAQRSKNELAAQIGIAPRSVSSVLASAGIVNERQFVAKEIRSLADFESIRPAWNNEVKGYPQSIEIGERKIPFDHTPTTTNAVARALASEGIIKINFEQKAIQRAASADELTALAAQRQQAAQRPAPAPKESTAAPSVLDVSANEPYFGKGFDPRFVFRQLTLMLEIVTAWQLAGAGLANRETGEIVDLPNDLILAARIVLNLLQDDTLGALAALPDDLLGFALETRASVLAA